jgi:hypothetical protein
MRANPYKYDPPERSNSIGLEIRENGSLRMDGMDLAGTVDPEIAIVGSKEPSFYPVVMCG